MFHAHAIVLTIQGIESLEAETLAELLEAVENLPCVMLAHFFTEPLAPNGVDEIELGWKFYGPNAEENTAKATAAREPGEPGEIETAIQTSERLTTDRINEVYRTEP